MPDPTLADITETIRKHAPGALPPGFFEGYGIMFASNDVGFPRPISDDIAAAVLRDAMTLDASLQYNVGPNPPETGHWMVRVPRGLYAPPVARCSGNEEHGGSSLLSCFAAWKWARGIE